MSYISNTGIVIPHFLHYRATQRKRRNFILGIKNQADEWCTQLDQVSAIFLDYYQQLFPSSNPKELLVELDSIPQTMTEDINVILSSEFQAWKVENALRHMAPLKATAGLDGMLLLFYQNFWGLVSSDVISSTLHFLNLGSYPPH